MKKVFKNTIKDYIKNLNVRNEYFASVVYSCCLSASNNNKMTVSKNIRRNAF